MTDLDLPAIPAIDVASARAAAERLDRLTKPRGSLGRLEELAISLAGMQARPLPSLESRAVVVVAADHGVTAQGVSAYPSEVTGQMVSNFLAGGAAINALSRIAGASLLVVDAGTLEPVTDPRVRSLRMGPGTADMSRGTAMSHETATEAVRRGAALADELGADVIACGEMGIGNTTAAAAIAAVLLDLKPKDVAGTGAGLGPEGVQHKAAVIAQALAVNRPDPLDALDVLAKVGGFEIAVLAGVMIGAASRRRVIVLDGVISTAAALIAARLAPGAREFMVAAHRSPEPAHLWMLDDLRLRPLLDLEMRLGEGSGAALALPILDAACRVLREMATFDEAGIAGSEATGDGMTVE
jgi:nicotinate-nucleotide--dimethylbenzimidazole phosphoribosyltransferase